MARKDFKTKAGLIPDEVHLLKTITTSDVQAFLQSKIDAAVASMVAKGLSQPPVNIDCKSTKAGTKIAPFAILLPMSTIVGDNKNTDNDDDGVLDIFKTEETKGKCKLKNEIFTTLAPYVYDANDGHAFNSEVWRREFGVSRDGGYLMSKMRVPKVTSNDHGRNKCVEFLLDPMRIFHDMMNCRLAFDGEKYRVRVESWKTIKTGQVSYVVVAGTFRDDHSGKKKKKKNGDNDNYIFALDRKMRGSR